MNRVPENDRDSVQDAVKRLPGEVRQILEKRVELFALDVSEGVSIILSRILFIIFGSIAVGIACLFLLMSLSYYLGQLLDNTALGYFLTAMPLILLGVAMFYHRPKVLYRAMKVWFIHQFVDLISKKITD